MSGMKRVIPVLALLSVAACGGGDGNGGSHKSAMDVAKAAACESPSLESPKDQEMFVTNTVTCTFNSHDVTIGWFKSSDAMKNYRKIADQMGGCRQRLLTALQTQRPGDARERPPRQLQ